MSGPLGVLVTLAVAIFIVVVSVLLKGRKGPLTTQAPDIDPSNMGSPNQSRGLHKRMQGWVIENWLSLFGVVGIVVVGAMAMLHKFSFAFVGELFVGTIMDWLFPALIALAAISLAVWAFSGKENAGKVAAVGIALCTLLAVSLWHSGHPLYREAVSITAAAIPRDTTPPPDIAWACPAHASCAPEDMHIYAWPTEKLAAHTMGAKIPVYATTHLRFSPDPNLSNSSVRIHCYDSHGDETIVGDAANPCVPGDVDWQQAENISDYALPVAHAYELNSPSS